MKKYKLDLAPITDWQSFHDLFSSALDFPDYYGRNLDAWIDCVGDLTISSGSLVFELLGMKELKERNRGIYEAIIDCSAFVNYRMNEEGDASVLALSYA